MTTYLYHPITFYLITVGSVFLLSPLLAYCNKGKSGEKYLLPLLFLGLSLPAITALTMIFGSQNEGLIQDFWERLFLFNIAPGYLLLILFLMPLIVIIATALSLLFGYSREQFLLANDFSVKKGWAIVGVILPIVIAPLIEEIGWRGYGVDSLRAYFSLFTTTMLFGALWALWHLPTFFVQGFYQNQLWHRGIVYVINFFVSVFVVSIIMNWVFYKTGRSIPALILFHSVLNFSSILLRTEQFTKCLVTLLFAVVSLIVIICDSQFFFS